MTAQTAPHNGLPKQGDVTWLPHGFRKNLGRFFRISFHLEREARARSGRQFEGEAWAVYGKCLSVGLNGFDAVFGVGSALNNDLSRRRLIQIDERNDGECIRHLGDE